MARPPIANAIRRLRFEHGEMTQAALAEKIGMTRQTVAAIEQGKYAPSLEGVSAEHLYEAMITGPQQMPVFSDQVLKPDDKRAIIGYLTQLNGQAEEGGLDLGGIGPVSEGLWAWILGLGTLMFFAVWIAAKGAKAK